MDSMAVKSIPFGPVIVSGEDAKSFQRQIRHGRSNVAAVQSAENGRRLVAIYAASLATGKGTARCVISTDDLRD
jgi:hypothetical protein